MSNSTNLLFKGTEINVAKAVRIQSHILRIERENIKSKEKSDAAIIKEIKKLIVEEVECL